MHGIIHHYASRLNRGYEEDIHGMSSHQYLSIHGDSPVDIPELLKNYRNVRTLIYPHDPFIRTVNCHVISKSNSLRALHLHSASFDRDLFELNYTLHLKYLDISGSRIKKLPESTSSLYFLQTLIPDPVFGLDLSEATGAKRTLFALLLLSFLEIDICFEILFCYMFSL